MSRRRSGTGVVSYEEYDACARLTLTVREDGRATRIAYGEWGDGGDAGEGGEGGEDWRHETRDASGDVRRETEDECVIEGCGEIVVAVVGGEDDTTVGRGVLTAPQPYPNGFPLPVGFGANGNLSMPVRVHEIRYGRTDSPRFTRTYTDGFGDVVREERSGANGATLVTENEYDAFGRLVVTAETDKPLVEYAYDEWGDRVAREESADDEWRLSETETASVVADDGEVWRETTATRSCSDAAIAPLVTTQRTRLSGLSLATNAVTITTDVRGNETVTTTTLDPATQSSHEITRTPGILNVATNWYTDGVMVSNISHNGVMTQIRRDALRRETARIDGRGNVTRTEYDSLGRVAATIDALTNATTYAYDANSQLLQVGNATPTNVILQYDYTYDAARRRIACMLSALRAVVMPMVKVL